MKLLTKYLPALLVLLYAITGCIKDGKPNCPDEYLYGFSITVTPKNVHLSYEAHTPASQHLTVTCLDIEGQPDSSIPWKLSIIEAANSWLELTLDPDGMTGKGKSVSGTGSRSVYLVAQENTTADIRTVELSIDDGQTVAVTVTQDIMPLQIFPPAILLTGVPHNPATQTVSVTSNQQWTLTSNQPWLTLTLNADGSGDNSSVTGNGSRTVYLVATGNGGDNIRTSDIYLNGIVTDVRVIVTQETLITEPGESAPRIFISESDEDTTLLLTKDPTNYGALFQYGSIIGWSWEEATAAYNPTGTLSLSTWNTFWNNGNKDVLHTHAELVAGKGDPCRLVGYSVEEIRAALDAGVALDNTLWRLPHVTENIDFGLPSSEWTTIKGVPGRFFIGTGEFLPAAGRRNAETAVYGQRGFRGFYISSSIDVDSTDPFLLFFDEPSIFTSDRRDGQSQGYSVRCVRQ